MGALREWQYDGTPMQFACAGGPSVYVMRYATHLWVDGVTGWHRATVYVI